MAEPFKNLINPALVSAAAAQLRRVQPDFDARRFIGLAGTGLETLELKARALQLCDALEATLPADFARAADLLEAALAPPAAGESVIAHPSLDRGLEGWVLWPVGEYAARHGQQQPQRALALLHALTQRFTAEFALRPFIVRHPALCWATLALWAADPSAHVRRLVSEGSRPRLPWGLQLKALIGDPSPTLPLLRALQDDASPYVRRSVANHLNDIAKDHPGLVADWLEEHLPGAPAARVLLLRHASRTLVKRGDTRTLAAWGLGRPLHGQATLALGPARLAVGGSVTLTVHLQSHATQPQRLAIDYALHHVKADGRTVPKVFKGWTRDLPAHGTLVLQKKHSMRAVTTRRYHPGRHRITVQVNGRTVAEAAFDLDPA